MNFAYFNFKFCVYVEFVKKKKRSAQEIAWKYANK